MELQRANALIDATTGLSPAESHSWQLSGGSDSAIPEGEWANYDDLMMHVSVAIPLQQVSLAYMAGVAAGTLLRSAWLVSEDVPLLIGDIFLASVCFEPAGTNLGVRISDFTARTPLLDLRRPSLLTESTKPVNDVDLTHVLQVETELLFGTMQMSLKELTRLALGDIILLNRPVNAPVEVVARGYVVASGTLLFSEGCYAVQVEQTALQSRILQPC